MSFGQNLQFLRKMHQGMTQEELAEKVGVSRQSISKWEMDLGFPEMEKALALSKIFACSLDDLLVNDVDSDNEAYTNICVKKLPAFRYVRYAVISEQPEEDALGHVHNWAVKEGIDEPELIGWDFPMLSQEQINVFHMHGYAAACILPEEFKHDCPQIIKQEEQMYAVITIKDPMSAPFKLIPNAYKTLMRYMDVNNLVHKESKQVIACFEKEYKKDEMSYMDVYIAIQG